MKSKLLSIDILSDEFLKTVGLKDSKRNFQDFCFDCFDLFDFYFENRLTYSGGSKNDFSFSSASFSLILSLSMMIIVQAPRFGIKQAMKICNAEWLKKFCTFFILTFMIEKKLKLHFYWKTLCTRSCLVIGWVVFLTMWKSFTSRAEEVIIKIWGN